MHFVLLLLTVFLTDCETVSESAYGYEVTRIRRVVLDLLSESVHIDHDGVLIDDGLAPDDAVDHVLGEDVVHVVDEKLDHGVLFCGQRDLDVILVEPQRRGVVGERSGLDYVARALR